MSFQGHIEWHLDAGLAAQFIEAPLEAQKFAANVPPVLYNHCKALGQPISGNAAGIASTTNLTGLPLGPYPPKLRQHQKGNCAKAG